MFTALAAPVARLPSATRSALSRLRITGRCAHSNVSSGAALCGSAPKALIIMRRLQRVTSDAGENAGILLRKLSRDCRATFLATAVTPRRVNTGAVVFQRRTGRGADRIEGSVESVECAARVLQKTSNAQRPTSKIECRKRESAFGSGS